jgi:large subunit ribosomal protein L2
VLSYSTLFLVRKRTTSNASRQLWNFTSKWYERQTHKHLTLRKKSSGGRSSLTGRTIVWTKQSILHKVKLPRINYNFRSKEPGFVSTFKLTPFSNKLLSLVVFASGSHSYFPATDSVQIFSLLAFRNSRVRSRTYSTIKTSHYSFIRLLPAFKKISNLELKPGSGVQYVRSSGCSARVIKFDKAAHVALIKLPSGVRKFFSMHSLGILGSCALKLKRKMMNTKSGFWRSYGLKPRVRGVARNPVDHPHGGRTKSIKYPRTPWGKTTKYK